MNVAILVADEQVSKRIQRFMSFMCGAEVQISTPAHADLLISDRPKPLLEFVDAGKRACQVLYAKHHTPLPIEATGGRDTRFRIYAFDASEHIFSYPDMRNLVAYLAALSTPASDRPSSHPYR